ncbi:outer membrane beta-barrel protein [Aestuariibaculum sediminum]|uniref:Outer membrane beta-barrel protein n=1 Tax=Aestuariibaculum sediminum TaxID=2770637 RepID=A0A8J6UHS1_9FLAO|nr:outer membrane beta-barrel protein [Aestuariibaculum sediminum]MBD0833281.1 outer membrane beta-barrel protein [Aestuariibaculum sediminum]
MFKNLILVLAILITSSSMAQKFTLQGTVKDEFATVLEGATVYLQSVKDSIPMAYGITNKNGEFSIQVNAEDDKKAIFNIAYLGYKPYLKDIDVPAGDELDLGVVTLQDQIEELNVVSIVGKAPPVVIKKDTIEYNADSFKTLPNDKAEDLLKKLPGVDIDIDGNITVNGVDVEAINVDGMRFFGEKKGDIALKNIPSQAISKVQVTDYKTDFQKFTGEESTSGTKEINLKIKKGQNRAIFGDVKGGYGTDDKYQGNANLFQMIDGKQLGIIAGTNNINMSRGFNALPDTDTSNGYIESDFVGANYTKGRWDETRVNANYRYSAQNTDTERTSLRENFLPDLNYITNSKSSGFNDSDSHNGNSEIDFIIEPENKASNNKVQISNNTSFNAANTDSGSTSKSTSEYTNGDLVSDYTSTNETSASNYNISNDFSVTPVRGGNGNYFRLGLNTSFNKSDSDTKKYSENILYNRGETIIQDQISENSTNSTNIGVNGVWSAKVTEDFRIIPSYNANVSTQSNELFIYDYDEVDDSYDNFNNQLSTDSRYIATTIRPSLRLRYDLDEFRFEVEAGHTTTYRNFKDQLIEARNFKADFNYLTYSGRIRYRDENGYKRISLDYNQNVNLPSMGQLQPVEDVTNITHIRVGNPDLEPQVDHRIRFRYQNNLAFHNINISGNANAGFTQDKIINSTITDADLNRYTTYTNINGDYSLDGNATITKSIFSKKTNININGSFNASFNNSLSVQNGIKFTGQTTRLTPSFSFRYAYDNKIDLSARYRYSAFKNVYDTDAFNDNNYFVQNINFDSSIFIIKNLFISNKISYRYNSRVGDDYDGDAVFWNAGLGMELWNNQATVTLVGYDVLGKNNGYRRNVTETFIEDSESRILEQYFMLNFTYKFGRFAGQPMNGGSMGSSRGNSRRR